MFIQIIVKQGWEELHSIYRINSYIYIYIYIYAIWQLSLRQAMRHIYIYIYANSAVADVVTGGSPLFQDDRIKIRGHI